MVLPPYDKYFNFSLVKSELQKMDSSSIRVLSFNHQIIYACINKQINDRAHWYKNISLRNSYDLFLLSKKEPIIKTLHNFSFPPKYLENFIISSFHIFNFHESLFLEKNSTNITYLQKERKYLNNRFYKKINFIKWNYYFKLRDSFLILNNSIYNKKNRKILLKRLFFLRK
jgi:hypothetical protein